MSPYGRRKKTLGETHNVDTMIVMVMGKNNRFQTRPIFNTTFQFSDQNTIALEGWAAGSTK